MSERQRKNTAVKALPDDMEYLKAKIAALSEHTGLPDDEDEEEGKEVKEDAEVPAADA